MVYHAVEKGKKISLIYKESRKGSELVFLNVYRAQNRFQGMNSASLCSLAGRYNNPIPPRFLAPIDCLKIPAQVQNHIWGSAS
jgi:hypothetical protein